MPPLLMAKASKYWMVGLIGGVVGVTTGTIVSSLSWVKPWGESQAAQTIPAKPIRTVTALGRLEPQAEVIRLSAPLSLEKDRVAELLIKPGDRVQAGQVVAILDSHDRLQLALQEAQTQVRVAQSRVEQIRAGAKTGEIQAQEATLAEAQAQLWGEIAAQSATIERWKSEVNNALAEYQRFQALYQEGTISASELDRKQLALETAQAQLEEALAQKQRTRSTLQAQINQAKARLSQIAEVRPVDLKTAELEVARAIAAMHRAKSDLDQAFVRAPIAGQILKIHARPGEKLSDNGIADLGQTRDMVVVAEVYQTDIAKVRTGQPAVITSQAFGGEVKGKVYEVGLQVRRQSVFSAQPGENLDRRVIEVKIRLSPKESKRVAALTNLQVQVAIAI